MSWLTYIGSILAAAVALVFIFALSFTALSILNALAAALGPRERPRFVARLGSGPARWVKGAHLLLCIFWVGGATSVVLLSVMAGSIADNEPAYAAVLRSICVLDDYIITPSAVLCVASGLLLSALSSWGVARHRWIVVKQALSFWALIFGVVLIRTRIHDALEAFSALGEAALQNPLHHQHSPANIVIGAVQMALLLVLTFVSVIKPWRKNG